MTKFNRFLANLQPRLVLLEPLVLVRISHNPTRKRGIWLPIPSLRVGL